MAGGIKWDITADSEKQSSLSTKINKKADDFDTKINSLYGKIDSIGTNNYWVGQDYDLFKSSCDGYKNALKDLSNSFRMYSKHMEKLSKGTDQYSSELIEMIKNVSTAYLPDDYIEVTGGSLAYGDWSYTGSAPLTLAVNTESYVLYADQLKASTASKSYEPVPNEDFWAKQGQRYVDDWQAYADSMGKIYDDIGVGGLVPFVLTFAMGLVDVVFLGVDTVFDTAETALDGISYGINWVFDIGTDHMNGGTNTDYWNNIGHDYAENWDYSNVDNIVEGAGVTLLGVGRTVVDAVQTAANGVVFVAEGAVDVFSGFIDGVVDFASGLIGFFF